MKTARINIHLLVTVLLLTAWSAFAQTSVETQFKAVEELRGQAESANAPLLSPETWQQAEQLLTDARRDFNQQKSTERIRARLDQSSVMYSQAESKAQNAATFFALMLDSRTAAIQANAAGLAEREWSDAETELRAAIKAHERDKLEAAQRDGITATELFRTAELEALRNEILSPARSRIAEIRRNKYAKWVPLTLKRIEALITQADALIVSDRNALDEPRSLATQATLEAERALKIATLAKRVDRKSTSVEELVLRWEKVLADIALAAEINPEPQQEPEQTAAEIIELLERLPGLRSDLADRTELVLDLEDEIRELDAKLGGASDDRMQLIRRLEEQARIRQQFAQVENLFSAEEAFVLRDGNNLIIRLVGMNFASNSAVLSAAGSLLLEKVRSAIDVFPQCDLTVEGHTDSQGNPERNKILSEERALAVKTHMIDQMRIPAFRIQSSGYGDTRPIANNRTAEGRAQNRRIDLIIVPNAASF